MGLVIVQSDLKIINCQSTVTNSGDQQRKCVFAIPKAALNILFHVIGKLERQTTDRETTVDNGEVVPERFLVFSSWEKSRASRIVILR